MNKYLVIVCLVVLAVLAFISFGHQDQMPIPVGVATLKSIGDGQQYYSTTTDSTWAAGTKLIRTGYGSFGSAIITVSTVNVVDIYDATTSDVTKRTGNTSTTTITLAHFSASPTVGTYTFDTSFTNGLLIQLSGTVTNIGSTTITYR